MAFSKSLAITESTEIVLLAGSTFESALKIGVTLALFQSLGIIPLEITKLKICVREDAMDGNESFKRQVGIPLRPSA